ncbi:hypothetical protein [Roseibium suaedae]|uniref:Uncharacterized protein n=1 Tax=Roseibium suaedae TaxID=735517 RepID=A0A1M7FQF9_9HYPH|nr:hypothetical protein [Roseibium suaedae]SHM06321.1 hypothetical protein SAMN05444272_1683 [Roseibium suaedae]
MSDLRPDVIFVIDGAVWRDFQELRERWEEPLCIGLRDECVRNIRSAIRAGKPDVATHWLRVQKFALAYGLSWVSAVEVDGILIRESPKMCVLRYPEDRDLKRVPIEAR